jgi:hypothetical protein
MTTRALVAVTLALGIPVLQPDAARVLADMRQALGGDAAIAAVTAFSISGHDSSDGGAGADVEWFALLPDNFVHVRRVSSQWFHAVETDGFRGDALIHRREADTPYPETTSPATPAEQAARDARAVRDGKHDFSRRAIALIGVPAVDPLDVSYDGQRSVAGRLCDLLRLRSSDGYTATFAVDAATHVPVSVSWMGPPMYTVYTTSTAVVQSSGSLHPSVIPPAPPAPRRAPPTPLPAGDPTAGMSPVEYQILFDDFKVVDGLNWPHRFTEKIGGTVVRTTRVAKYKVNPKINPKLFDATHR